MHVLKIRCAECNKFFLTRRPTNDSRLIPKIIPLLICPHCHPEQSDDVCGGCRLPFTIVGRHSKQLCETCFIQNWRYEKRITKMRLIIESEADSDFAST